MSFLDEFQADLEALPNILQKKYALLRDLDKSLEDLKRQNEQRCEQEIEEIKQGVKSGNTFSDEVLDEQKHSIRIADEKVALAVHAYDLVDTHIQQLDQYLKKFNEELRRDKESVPPEGISSSGVDAPPKSGRGSESGLAWLLQQQQKPLMQLPQILPCKIEWFHYGCVGLKDVPKGKWYCSDCAGLKSRKKGRR
ncbi:PHD finger protein ING1 isoform X3 [Rhodamnia argentea]|uniref:PHD finger protein ING1 isoform X3 n=1 Tax=Rhodamnia argentea TaxID=178133 RepID=A0ABM3HUC2_9MYRT|nr:PHD finger protein ING1 isoform X3 [Rhodamnia argentea]